MPHGLAETVPRCSQSRQCEVVWMKKRESTGAVEEEEEEDSDTRDAETETKMRHKTR